MKYYSTRDKTITISPSEAIIQGISKDGGLFVPKSIPQIDDLMELTKLDYRELAYYIMSKFFTDFDPSLLKEAIIDAYGEKFSHKGVVAVEKVKDSYILELFHGPTFAFKDMALSILPHLLRIALKANKVDKEVVILTATSGDTGKAALEGFANVEGVKIVVFFPEKGVSQIQKLQMLTQEGDNTFVVGIEGNFDDAQRGVKAIFNDREFNEILNRQGYILSSANSINIGRLIPQIVYYFYGYLDLLRQGEIELGEKVNIVVPTGNFGNILAAYYGKKMGLPVNKLICASNENNVLTDFFNRGVYDRRRKLKLTSSPSMDILISSNLERLLFYILNEDDAAVKDKMERLNIDGYYRVQDINIEDFYGDYSTEEEVTRAIRDVFVNYNYLMDPHTAVAYSVYDKYRLRTKDDTKTIIAATASPFKFGKKIADSLGLNSLDKDEFQILEELGDRTGLKVPEGISSLKDKAIRHNNYCSKEEMKDMLYKFLKVGEGHD
ncbi:MAG: threonine synthase [Tissierellia bacterium]|nr:threonine synthase [Tissierellia bacterium]